MTSGHTTKGLRGKRIGKTIYRIVELGWMVETRQGKGARTRGGYKTLREE